MLDANGISGTAVGGGHGYLCSPESVPDSDDRVEVPCGDRRLRVRKDCLAAPKGDDTPLGHLDLPMLRLQAIAAFIRDHKAPKTVNLDAKGRHGQKLFNEVGCNACHRSTLTTSKGIEFNPYSDLLLHDMGEELQDERPEFLATEREFRTAPLWGIGQRVRKQHRFLHDARAKTPEEAILWHGGEAQMAKSKFIKLDQEQRLALLHFLEQL